LNSVDKPKIFVFVMHVKFLKQLLDISSNKCIFYVCEK
jgi:hypothetical protein